MRNSGRLADREGRGAIRGVMTDMPSGEKSLAVALTGEEMRVGSLPLCTVNTTGAMIRSLSFRLRSLPKNAAINDPFPLFSPRRGAEAPP